MNITNIAVVIFGLVAFAVASHCLEPLTASAQSVTSNQVGIYQIAPDTGRQAAWQINTATGAMKYCFVSQAIPSKCISIEGSY